jgi:hypothetical protein
MGVFLEQKHEVDAVATNEGSQNKTFSKLETQTRLTARGGLLSV